MKKVILAVTGSAALLACGSGRPPWADGALVTERVEGPLPPQDLAKLAERIAALHNAERRRVGTPALTWDATLATSAAPYAAELARRGRLEHSLPAARPGEGENLWLGTRGAYSIEDMVGSWSEERRLFRAGTFPDVSTSGAWSDVGHYTQMIWRGTTRVGCAIRSSDRWDVLVCRYAPGGNVLGQPVP